MYAKMLERKFKCSKETLDTLIAGVDTATLQAEENSALTHRKIDPPVINGITLTEHPNAIQREKYRKIYNNGGCIVGVYVGGKMQSIVTTVNGVIGKKVQDFENVRLANVHRNVANRIGNAIDSEFESTGKNDRAKRPKNMSPADFWVQFSDKEVTAINLSLTPAVVTFVELVNGKNIVPLKSTPIQAGITMLHLNELLSDATFRSLTEV